MIKDHIAQVNDELAAEARIAACQIRRFLILPKELDADDGEITRTSKSAAALSPSATRH